jgi:flavin reductase (DIM6/NTAB) family NADH-FMN oxidoreductase RutF
MFYRPGRDDHGLPHNPFKALVAPRPIGWISSRDAEGRANLAPYSFFNGLGDRPPMVMFSANGRKAGEAAGEVKDSVANARETGVFAANIVGRDMAEAMNISAGHYTIGDDEFARAGLEAAPCETIDCPRVARSPATLECRVHQIVDLPGEGVENRLVIGVVTGIHIRDDVIRDGLVDVTRYQPLARLGYMDYAAVTETFSMRRPG